jgi:hypothetical protein
MRFAWRRSLNAVNGIPTWAMESMKWSGLSGGARKRLRVLAISPEAPGVAPRAARAIISVFEFNPGSFRLELTPQQSPGVHPRRQLPVLPVYGNSGR